MEGGCIGRWIEEGFRVNEVGHRSLSVESAPVLLFDGECGLCGAVVRFVLRRAQAGMLCVARLQSRVGQEQLMRLGLPTDAFDSLVYLASSTSDSPLLRTDGVLALLDHLGGGWRHVAAVGALVPAVMRDWGYRLVAKTRYAVFGQAEFRASDYPQWADRIREG